MTRRSFNITADELQGDTIILRGRRRAHFLKAHRAATGGELELVGPGGELISARLRARGGAKLVLEVSGVAGGSSPVHELVLAAAVLKPKKMEFLVEKAAELGATCILPLLTARTVAAGKGGAGSTRLSRWRAKAREAAAMNRRPRVSRVLEPCPLGRLELLRGGTTLVLVADASLTLSAALRRGRQKDLMLVVGPEGDFTPAELAALVERGARTVRLGGEVLRAETAAISALAIVNSLWEWQ